MLPKYRASRCLKRTGALFFIELEIHNDYEIRICRMAMSRTDAKCVVISIKEGLVVFGASVVAELTFLRFRLELQYQ